MEKQKAENWKIALDYFVPSLVIGSLVAVLWAFAGEYLPEGAEFDIFGAMLAASLGAIYGAKKINKKYFVVSSKKIVEIALGYYMAVLIILEFLAEYALEAINVLNPIGLSLSSVGGFLIVVNIYGFASLWFLKTESELQSG